jgi:hypothetical protein
MERIVYHLYAPGRPTARNGEANAILSQTPHSLLGSLSQNLVMGNQSSIDIGENEGNGCGRIIRFHAFVIDTESESANFCSLNSGLGDPTYCPEPNRIGWPSILLKWTSS